MAFIAPEPRREAAPPGPGFLLGPSPPENK
jgi:hypothetical protein